MNSHFKGESMKTNLDSIFKTSDALEKNGVWFDVSPETGFLVKPFKATNPNIKAAMAHHYKPYARQMEMGTIAEEMVRAINVKIFVQACLVDWKGVEIDGEIVPFSKDVAVDFLMELPDLFETLLKYAQDFKTYQADVGNSSPAK